MPIFVFQLTQQTNPTQFSCCSAKLSTSFLRSYGPSGLKTEFERLHYKINGILQQCECNCKSAIKYIVTSDIISWQPRNSCHWVYYVFVAQAAFACHWSWIAVGDDQCPTEGDSRLRSTWEPLQRATDVRAQHADGLAASVAAVTLVWCGHTDGRLWPGGQQHSAPTTSNEVVRR